MVCPLGNRDIRPACARLEDEGVGLSLNCPRERVLLTAAILFGELNKQWIHPVVAETRSVGQQLAASPSSQYGSTLLKAQREKGGIQGDRQ